MDRDMEREGKKEQKSMKEEMETKFRKEEAE